MEAGSVFNFENTIDCVGMSISVDGRARNCVGSYTVNLRLESMDSNLLSLTKDLDSGNWMRGHTSQSKTSSLKISK